MKKIAVVYWSGTGNTEQMARQVAAGAQEAGAEAEVIAAAWFSASQVGSFDAIAFGCPAMGAEELEADEFAPMFGSLPTPAPGQTHCFLFGSYGWGDGEWMRSWEGSCVQGGAIWRLPVSSARKRLTKRQTLPAKPWAGPWPGPDRDSSSKPPKSFTVLSFLSA